MNKVPFLNLNNLRIARENVGLETKEVSRKIVQNGKDVVLDWENGDSLPTWKQAEKLASMYAVNTFLLLSESEQLSAIKQIPDYRVGVSGTEKSNIKKLIHVVLKRQKWLSNQIAESQGKNSVLGSGKKYRSPQQLADFIKSTLEIDLEEIKKLNPKQGREALKYLIKKTEDKGIFVGKTISYHKITVEEMRGMFIADEYAPYIVLNRKDSISAQIFSLVHELAHAFRKTESISNSLEFRKVDNLDDEEVFCNQVAIDLLLPTSELTDSQYSKEAIVDLAGLYKISSLATFYKLQDLGKIDVRQQKSIEMELKRESQQHLMEKKMKEEKQSGGDYNNNMKDSNGDLFNRYVASAYHSESIGYTEAARLLKLSPENV